MTTVNTFKTVGIKAVPVMVEASVEAGTGFALDGLQDAACMQSTLRTLTALQANGYHVPGKKVVIKLFPSDFYKTGAGYDLAIAIGLIGASGQEQFAHLESTLVVGELSLAGEVRAVAGCVPAVLMAKEMGLTSIILPSANAEEVRPFCDGLAVYPVSCLKDAIRVLNGDTDALPEIHEIPFQGSVQSPDAAWNSISGNEGAKRALEIAAAGGHNLLLIGVPGSGKAALAKALMELLPPMSPSEYMETAQVYSISGRGKDIASMRRPFRSPHISSSMAAMLGGGPGDNVLPGEVSLANNGVLLLDEFAEMPKAKLDALRGPMEDGKVTISRLKSKVDFPAHFQLVATSNPCPCGYYGDGDRCTCTTSQRAAYLARLSGPVMERIAVQAWVHPASSADVQGETLDIVRERVAKARERQLLRQGCLNENLSSRELLKELRETDAEFIEKLVSKLGLSAGSFSKILKLARTIADLEDDDNVSTRHLAEAASFRFLDRMSVLENK